MKRINKENLAVLSAALTTGEIVAANEPPKLTARSSKEQFYPLGRTRRSIRERILTASSIAEVQQLLSTAFAYRKISPRTLRQIETAAEIRTVQLNAVSNRLLGGSQ